MRRKKCFRVEYVLGKIQNWEFGEDLNEPLVASVAEYEKIMAGR